MKSQGLPFENIKHQVSTIDAQPSNEAGGILVMVTGALLVCFPWGWCESFHVLMLFLG